MDVKIEKVSLEGEFSGKEIFLDSLNVECGGGNIIAHAKITDLDKFESRIKTEKLRIELLYPKIRETFKGAVSFDITAAGDLKNPTIKGEIELEDSYMRDKRLSDMKVDLSLSDLLAELNLDLGFLLNAKVDFNDSNYSFRADFKKWDYTFLIPDSTVRKRIGFINGYIQGSGNLKQLQDYNIKADLDSILLNIDGRNIVAGNKLSAEFTKGILTLDKFKLNLLDEGFIQAEGAVSPESDLNFNIHVNLPVRSLGFIMSDLHESKGNVKGDFEIRGQLTGPEVTGKINLEKIVIIVPVTEQKVFDLNGEIILETDKITVKSISGRIEKGRFNIDGYVNLLNNKIESSNLNLYSVALPVDYEDYFEGILTSTLNYSGNLSKGRLKGELLFVEGLYYQEFDPFGKVFKDKGRKILRGSGKKDSAPDISLDLKLNSRHSLVIDNSSAFIELNPDIEIKGSLSDPLITGRATMEKGGFIVFQKNTFSINRGVLDFAPVHGMLPTVDVQSETTVSDFTVYLEISGNLQNPRFSLSSIPQKSHADILTILLLGKNVNEFLKGNETAVSGTKEKFLANWIYNTFQQDIAKKFGLDYLEFSVSDGFSADDVSGTGLTIGKNISDRLILKYSASNNDSRFIQKGIADYQFFENIIFSGFQSTDGKFGAEIKYKLEYR
jgi:translocation and assembly module TamB